MKNIYTAFIATLLIPSLSYADTPENKAYAGIELGWSKGLKLKNNTKLHIGKNNKGGSGIIGATIGFYPTQNTKLDLSIQHALNMKYSKTVKGTTFMSNYNTHITNFKLYSVFISSYYLFKNDSISPFIGAGIGYTKIKGSYVVNSSIAKSNNPLFFGSQSIKAKATPSYRLTFGVQLNTGEKSKIDISYNYTHYGKVYFTDLTSSKYNKSKAGLLKGYSIMISPKIEF